MATIIVLLSIVVLQPKESSMVDTIAAIPDAEQPVSHFHSVPSEHVSHDSGISLELMCAAMNVYWEARNQPIAGQVAVAQITMNRVASPNYPNDVCGVVHQLSQFSWQWDGKSDVPREEEAWARAQMVARGVLAGSGHDYLMDVNITHYHAAYVRPYWASSMKLVAKIGDHLIYLDKAGP